MTANAPQTLKQHRRCAEWEIWDYDPRVKQQIVPYRVRGFSLSMLLVAVVLCAAVFAGALMWWSEQALQRPAAGQGAGALDLSIAPGSSASSVARAIAKATGAGIMQESLLQIWLRVTGQAAQLKAGSYEIQAGESPRKLIDKIVAGEQSLRAVTFIEGWTWRQMRAALTQAPDLKQDSAPLSDAQIMARLGRAQQHPEGRFFPDTYRYPKHTSDLSLLKTALQAMDKQLAQAWRLRSPDSPLRSPDELLIMASIVEKETGSAQERTRISAVFSNRLKINMRLQTDPTVIYGLGESFDGDLRKRDLQTDTAYNTYTRAGLPPTPIAMPGAAALQAAAQPAPTSALYFVAKGDGSSAFSETLPEHNRAVRQYQLKQ